MKSTPDTYARRILISAAGLSPQVITETVYALAVQQAPAFAPTEVHLVTTAEGAERARLSLLGDEPGWFGRLRRDYGLPAMRFDEQSLHVIRDAEDRPLSDIRSGEDNRVVADQVTELVRRFTAAEDAAVHASMAGGRKTLGFYLAYALSLFGRPQDRLSHVLVSPPFESHPEFYYPTPERRVIYTPQPDSRPLDTSRAEVTLAEIPFVRLREWLPAALLASPASYGATVAAAQQRLGPAEVKFNLRGRTVEADGAAVPLPPADLAFYSWMARRRAAGAEAVSCPSEGAPEEAYGREFLAEYERITAYAGGDDRTRRALRRGMEKDFFLQRRSRLHKALRRVLGARAAAYEVKAIGQRPETRYELEVDPARIGWKD